MNQHHKAMAGLLGHIDAEERGDSSVWLMILILGLVSIVLFYLWATDPNDPGLVEAILTYLESWGRPSGCF